MKLDMNLLKNLLKCNTPCGHEHTLLEVWNRSVANVGTTRIDPYYNIITTLPSAEEIPNNSSIMLNAHSDEIGLVVTYINKEGFVYVNSLGGWDIAVILGQQVTILGENNISGVISRPPIHELSEKEDEKLPKFGDIFIDIGAKDEKEAKKVVSIGDPVLLDKSFKKLLNKKITGRGIDNRISIFVLLETLKDVSKKYLGVDAHFVASVQEESTMQGALTVVNKLNPALAINVDVALATDTPNGKKETYGEVNLGKGPIIYIGLNINTYYKNLLIDMANKNNIPYQIHPYFPGGTESSYISSRKSGIPTLDIGIPCRYMHTTVEVVSLVDVEKTIELLSIFLTNVDKNELLLT